MATTKHEVGPRKVTEVHTDGNTTTRTDFTLDAVEGGSEDDFIAAFRVYDVDEYEVATADNDSVVVEWAMLNGDEFTVTYAS